MFDFFLLIRDFWVSIFHEFDIRPLQIAGYSVSLVALIFAFMIFGFVVSALWKGAKT